MNPMIPIRLLPAAVCLAVLTACTVDRAPMVAYEPVDAYSWDAAERLVFDLGPVPASGDYGLTLHVRTTTAAAFPFKVLYVEVRQQWNASKTCLVDTVACAFQHDERRASGISLHQYAFPFSHRRCQAMDSVRLTVRHLMRKEEITGIDNVGIELVPAE